jgi:predicted acetyltransferase
VYRGLGFEYAGVWTVYRMPIEAIPRIDPAEAADLVEITDADVDGVRASYLRWVERENGMTDGDPDFWRGRVLMLEQPPGGVAVRVMTASASAAHGPDGYASYQQERGQQRWTFDVVCRQVVAHTRPAALGLLAHVRGQKSLGRDMVWSGPPGEPLAYLVPEHSIGIDRIWRFMCRILDVVGAFEARGYPTDVEGEATISVDDPVFADNTGRFRLRASGGRVEVTRDAGASPSAAIGIGALSAMFTGELRPATAVSLGLVDPDDPSIPLVTRLLAGPPPWTPDFF